MTKDWVQLLPLMIPAVVLPLAFWRSRVTRKRTAENLREIGQRLGLGFQPATDWTKSPCLTGKLRGRPADVFTCSTGSGKSRRNWAVISVQAEGAETLTFTLQKQGLGTRLSEFMGVKEITVGDPAFDATWFIQTNWPDAFGTALLPEVRAKLMAVRLAGAEGKFEFNGRAVKYTERDQLSRSDGIELVVAVAGVVTDLAELVEVAESKDGVT